MDKRIGLFAGLTALFAMGSAGAQTCPTEPAPVLKVSATNPETGHQFEIYEAPGITWLDAKACASSKVYPSGSDIQGHLATLTSDSEDLWVNNLRLTPGLGLGEVWVGGSQPPSANVGDGWTWENSEGVIATPQFPRPSYSKWLPGEPNDAGGSESYLAIGLSNTTRGWNDEGYLPNITGFVVEYETPRTAGECTDGTNTSTEACTTINGQTLTFPAGTFEPGDTIQFTAYEFTDPRVVTNQLDPLGRYGKCRNNPGPLTLFKVSDGFEPGVELRIPPYLCGSPKFVVVKVNSKDITIQKGTVFVEHETKEKVLPNNLYQCFDPILGRQPPVGTPYAPDPQFQDVVVWQTTDPENMAENATVAPLEYVGAATEATRGCGSTTAKVRGASYFVVGMHIDFRNDAYDYASSPLQNYQQFVALTQYKLSLLQQSVAKARLDGAIRNPDAQSMTSQLNSAVTKLNANNPAAALTYIDKFVARVNTVQYLFPPGVTFNYNGDHLMRGENLQFTLRVKVIPYK